MENRTRFALEIAKAVREAWGLEKSLFVRLSASDWHEHGEKDEQGNWISWDIEQTKYLADKLAALGVDLIDTSSAGVDAAQKIVIGPGCQVRLMQAGSGGRLLS